MATTASSASSSDPRRQFAVSVVETLRDAGFEALWAGGCVRDQLLGKSPKDYDVASTATPDEVIRIFGTRRTIPVGASFGVVMVLGPTKSAGQIEIATFRSDGEYLDGRRPNSVQFCRPEEDARRRDFTINGLFFDPIRNEVIDYVGGREDLAAGVVRAIGDPVDRFREDKLRMLRAVRFAATFRFHLDVQTADAIRQFATQLSQVSVERIAQELRRMLSHSTRATAAKMLEETSLFAEVLPEISSIHGLIQQDEILDALGLLESASFEAALSLLLRPLFASGERENRHRVARIEEVCRRLKMSNEEIDCVCWLLNSLPVLENIASQPLHIFKPLLNHPHAQLLLDVSSAIARSCRRDPVDAEFCRRYLSRTSPETLAPATLIDGRDVMGLGIPAGPVVRELLTTIRNEQLDERLATREQALVRLRELYLSAR